MFCIQVFLLCFTPLQSLEKILGRKLTATQIKHGLTHLATFLIVRMEIRIKFTESLLICRWWTLSWMASKTFVTLHLDFLSKGRSCCWYPQAESNINDSCSMANVVQLNHVAGNEKLFTYTAGQYVIEDVASRST